MIQTGHSPRVSKPSFIEPWKVSFSKENILKCLIKTHDHSAEIQLFQNLKTQTFLYIYIYIVNKTDLLRL